MKQYVKPDLYYENFELSQHIATCGIDVNNSTMETCAHLDPDLWGYSDQVFTTESGCAMDISLVEGYCETVGTNEKGRTFNS